MNQVAAISPARPDEWTEAFGLVFQHLPPEARDRRVANALPLIHGGQLDPAGVLVARDAGGLVGALVCQPVAGAGGLVWPPQVRAGAAREPVEDALLREGSAWLRRHGTRLGLALLSPTETHLAPALERNGFPHITTLWYLRHDLKLPYALVRREPRLTFIPYPDDPARFRQTLLRTYEATLDCPEVNGVRSVDEILAGHRAQGVHDPRRWWLAADGAEPVGVLLLTETPELEAWDVSYVGVVPPMRRRGWGRELMHQALRAAHASDAHQLILSVDGRNKPAWKLYVDLGFEAYDAREVYLAVWRAGASGAKSP
jgi:ribosomal protein S18 acetylase RimI-like enzyme